MSDYETQKSVARANRGFYRAFERLDLDAMSNLWVHDRRARCIHPGGEVLVGHDRVLASWGAIFQGSEGLRFEILDLAIEILGDLAWVTCIERIHANAGANAESSSEPTVDTGFEPESESPEEMITETAATNLYVHEDGEWKMLLHHASPIARRFFAG